MLALALAYWWVLGRGIWVHRLQLRRPVDRCKHPKCSLFTWGCAGFIACSRWTNYQMSCSYRYCKLKASQGLTQCQAELKSW